MIGRECSKTPNLTFNSCYRQGQMQVLQMQSEGVGQLQDNRVKKVEATACVWIDKGGRDCGCSG